MRPKEQKTMKDLREALKKAREVKNTMKLERDASVERAKRAEAAVRGTEVTRRDNRKQIERLSDHVAELEAEQEKHRHTHANQLNLINDYWARYERARDALAVERDKIASALFAVNDLDPQTGLDVNRLLEKCGVTLATYETEVQALEYRLMLGETKDPETTEPPHTRQGGPGD